MADKLYWFKFYPDKWLNDTGLQMASIETIGVWIQVINRMWFAETRGELTGTLHELSRSTGCSIEQFESFLNECERFKIADVKRSCNALVTVSSRLMKREEIARKKAAKRVRKHRDNDKKPEVKRSRNANVTPQKLELRVKNSTSPKGDLSNAHASDGPPPYAQIRDLYNSTCLNAGLIRQCKPTGKKWKEHFRARWQENPGFDWTAFFERIAKSPFLRGDKTGFVTDIMWIMRPENFEKIDGGRYDPGPSALPIVEEITSHFPEIYKARGKPELLKLSGDAMKIINSPKFQSEIDAIITEPDPKQRIRRAVQSIQEGDSV